MSKIRKKLAEMLQAQDLSLEILDDLLEKDESVILSLNLDYSGFDRVKSEEFSTQIKAEISKIEPNKKITIILTSSKKLPKNGDVTENSVKSSQKEENNAKIKEKSGIFGFFGGKSVKKVQNIDEKQIAGLKYEGAEKKELKNKDDEGGKSAQDFVQSPQKQNSKSVVGVKKIIAVASAKGGVGKSTFAVNLAASLRRIGHKVAIVDADIYGPSIPHLMNLQGKPKVKDGLFIPLIAHEIKSMSIGSMIDADAAGVWRGPMITKILNQLVKSVNWNFDGQDVDYMIIDMPPGTGDVYLSLAQTFAIDGVVIVSTAQSVAVVDVVRSIDCFNKLKVPILGVVQNMAYLENDGKKQYIFGQDGARKMAQERGLRFLGDIAIAQEISDAGEERIPFVMKNPASNLAFVYGKIAEDILDEI